MGLGTLLNKNLFGQDPDRDRRELEARAMMTQLIEAGLQPAEVNAVVNDFIRGGTVNLPTARTKELPPVPGVGPRSTREEISFGKKEVPRVPVRFNKDTGKAEPIEIPGLPAGASPEFLDYNPPDERDAGEKEDPTTKAQRDAAKSALSKYLDAAKATDSKGELKPISPEIEAQAVEAAKFLGLGAERDLQPGTPSFFQNIQNALSTATRGAVPAAQVENVEGPLRFTFPGGRGAGEAKEKAIGFLKSNYPQLKNPTQEDIEWALQRMNR